MTTETFPIGSGAVRVLTKDDCMKSPNLASYFENRTNRYNIENRILTTAAVANKPSKGKEVLESIVNLPAENSWNDLKKAFPIQVVQFGSGDLALKFEPALDKERILVAAKGRLVMITRKEDAKKQDPFTTGSELLDKADAFILNEPYILSEFTDSDYQYESITLEEATKSYIEPLRDSAISEMVKSGSTASY